MIFRRNLHPPSNKSSTVSTAIPWLCRTRDANATHPPKVEFFPKHTFVILRGLLSYSQDLHFENLQIAYFIGENFLITRHNGKSMTLNKWWQDDTLAAIMQRGFMCFFSRLSNSLGPLYLEMLLEFEPNLTEYEDQLLSEPDDNLLRELIHCKTRLRKLRRNHSYHDRVFQELNTYVRDNAEYGDDIEHVINDVFEKFERLHSLSSLYYDLSGDLIDGYISLSSHKLNATMRILTVLTAIFVPLGFLAGVYGMNFDNMPELHNPHGYFILVGVMFSIALLLVTLFRKYRWL